MSKIFEIVTAYGHENIRATHKTTFEITKEKELSPRGDCIIGVGADKSVKDLNEEIKRFLKSGGKLEVILRLPDYGIEERVIGFGSEKMTFSDENDIVVRRSEYVCGRTLLIKSNKAAMDLSREFVNLLRDRKTVVEMLMSVEK